MKCIYLAIAVFIAVSNASPIPKGEVILGSQNPAESEEISTTSEDNTKDGDETQTTLNITSNVFPKTNVAEPVQPSVNITSVIPVNATKNFTSPRGCEQYVTTECRSLYRKLSQSKSDDTCGVHHLSLCLERATELAECQKSNQAMALIYDFMDFLQDFTDLGVCPEEEEHNEIMMMLEPWDDQDEHYEDDDSLDNLFGMGDILDDFFGDEDGEYKNDDEDDQSHDLNRDDDDDEGYDDEDQGDDYDGDGDEDYDDEEGVDGEHDEGDGDHSDDYEGDVFDHILGDDTTEEGSDDSEDSDQGMAEEHDGDTEEHDGDTEEHADQGSDHGDLVKDEGDTEGEHDDGSEREDSKDGADDTTEPSDASTQTAGVITGIVGEALDAMVGIKDTEEDAEMREDDGSHDGDDSHTDSTRVGVMPDDVMMGHSMDEGYETPKHES